METKEPTMNILTVEQLANLRKYLRINQKGELFLLDGTSYTIEFVSYIRSNVIVVREVVVSKMKTVFTYVKSWCY